MAEQSDISQEASQSIPTIQTTDSDLPKPFITPQRVASSDNSIQLREPRVETLVPHQKFSVQEKDSSASGATCLLSIPKDSPLFKRHWVEEPLDTQEDNPLAVLEEVQKAVGEVVSARENLDQCFSEAANSTLVVSQEESTCHQETEKYKQKCAMLIEKEEEMRQYYENRCDCLEEKFKSMHAQKEASDKQHEKQEADLRTIVELQSKLCNELEKRLGKQESELTDFQSKFKAKQQEVKLLREQLQEQEKELGEMEKELNTRTTEFTVLRTEVTIGKERKTVKEQIERCEEIRALVQRLPNATREDTETITKQIMNDIARMKTNITMKKALSFR